MRTCQCVLIQSCREEVRADVPVEHGSFACVFLVFQKLETVKSLELVLASIIAYEAVYISLYL